MRSSTCLILALRKELKLVVVHVFLFFFHSHFRYFVCVPPFLRNISAPPPSSLQAADNRRGLCIQRGVHTESVLSLRLRLVFSFLFRCFSPSHRRRRRQQIDVRSSFTDRFFKCCRFVRRFASLLARCLGRRDEAKQPAKPAAHPRRVG